MPSYQVRVGADAATKARLRGIGLREGASTGAVARRIVRSYLNRFDPEAAPALIATFARCAHGTIDVEYRVWFSEADKLRLSRLAQCEQATPTCCVRAIVALYLDRIVLRASSESRDGKAGRM
jgi:hypothetical protein